MVKGLALVSTLAVVAMTAAGCGVHEAASAPSLTGPSQLAMAVTMTANPDRISLDGGSQSLVTVQVRGANAQVLVNVPLRVDMVVNGVVQDYGKLNSRNIVTGTDGNAFVVYTAPALAAGANQPYPTVSIQTIIVGTDAVAAIPHTVSIALVPNGVILPPADTPTASFVVTPTPVTLNVAASFDASASCPGAKNAVGCLPSSSAVITNYSWSFGDGATASAKTVSHTFSAIGTFNVTLTITNDRGVTASTTQAIVVGSTSPPTAAVKPTTQSPAINQAVNFNAGASAAAPGRTIASYSWNFGDGATGSGINVTHAFVAAGAFTVTLTVTDDVGQKSTASQTESVAAAGPPTAFASFTFSPAVGVVNQPMSFDGSASTPSIGGGVIVSWVWNFGDTSKLFSGGPTIQHTYLTPPLPPPPPPMSPYTVTLTVTDTLGRTGTTTKTVAVQ
jgi:PKD repeat protein